MSANLQTGSKKTKQNDRFNDAQKSELEKLGNDGPIALPDAARRDINEATLSWARGSNKDNTVDRDPKHRRIYHKDGTHVDVFGTRQQKSDSPCVVIQPEDIDLDQWEASSSVKEYFDRLRQCKGVLMARIKRQRLASNTPATGATQPARPSPVDYDFRTVTVSGRPFHAVTCRWL